MRRAWYFARSKRTTSRWYIHVIVHDLPVLTRAIDWWEAKLAPVFAFSYATALIVGAPLLPLVSVVAIMLLSLVPGGCYVGVINDLTDREDDAAAGKRNRTIGRPAWQVALVIAVCLAIGAAWLITWRDRPLLFAVYGAAWIVYSMYSIPPVRLKTRGLAGAACDALGAHLFPIMVGVLLTFEHARVQRDLRWLGLVALWATAYGFRNILWHQLADRDHDIRSGVATFAVRHEKFAERAVLIAIFPIELAALAAVLWQLGLILPPLALILYVIFIAVRRILRGTGTHVIRERSPGYFAMQGYYDFLFPLSLLITSALVHSNDAVMLALHFLIFPKRPRLALLMTRRMFKAMRSPSSVLALRRRTLS